MLAVNGLQTRCTECQRKGKSLQSRVFEMVDGNHIEVPSSVRISKAFFKGMHTHQYTVSKCRKYVGSLKVCKMLGYQPDGIIKCMKLLKDV